MSADNWYLVRKHPLGGFTYVMGFASDVDEHGEERIPDVSERSLQFPTVEAALTAALAEYSEYGVSVHEECNEAEAAERNTKHNHLTRDIKKDGVCDACDEHRKTTAASAASESSSVDAPAGPVCINCRQVLDPVFPFDVPADRYQLKNALWVGFFGGYGMYVDELADMPGARRTTTVPGTVDAEAVLCGTCADAMCATYPWMDRLLHPENHE